MDKTERIEAFIVLGNIINENSTNPDKDVLIAAEKENPWFIKEFVIQAFKGLSVLLNKKNLKTWLESYHLTGKPTKTVGIVMPGNIPLAGFHDFLCTLVSGHNVMIHTSHSDSILIRYVAEELIKINDEFRSIISFRDKLTDADAIIATGSDNSSRYFNYYFRNIPHIVRRNRTSCAVLDGNESTKDLQNLADDIFLYFGLGCRNVSKIFLPEGYAPDNFKSVFSKYKWLTGHKKYYNNYLYRKSISSLSDQSFIDGEFFLLSESDELVSPVSVIYFQKYKNAGELNDLLSQKRDKIQCIVTGNSAMGNRISYGRAQFPSPWDYADQIDTLEFLDNLHFTG